MVTSIVLLIEIILACIFVGLALYGAFVIIVDIFNAIFDAKMKKKKEKGKIR